MFAGVAAAQPAASQPAATTSATAFDFNGFWSSGPEFALGGGKVDPNAQDLSVSPPLRNGDLSNLTNDGVIARRATNNLPLYKPEYWDKVVDLDYNGNLADPFNSCMPMSIPRMGPPRKILVQKDEVLLFYIVPFQRNDFRIVPFGPRKHPVSRDGTWMGDSVARWDGPDLVIETEGFNAESWFGPQGYFHGYEMKVTERFTPKGNTISYQATVEDPEFLQKPWQMDPITLSRSKSPDVRLEESPPCSERDNKNLVGKQREM